jgi:hypothetical protein
MAADGVVNKLVASLNLSRHSHSRTDGGAHARVAHRQVYLPNIADSEVLNEVSGSPGLLTGSPGSHQYVAVVITNVPHTGLA